MLAVAESEVLIVDQSIGGEQFTTRITTSEDEVIAIDSLF